MSDSRLTPANGRVAAAHLKGQVAADTYRDGVLQQVGVAVADLCSSAGGPRTRQLLLGALVTVYDSNEDWHFVQSDADGYCGYIHASLRAPVAPTHRVASFATHAYAEESFKSPVRMGLPFGARLAVIDERRKFFETSEGFVPKSHLRPLDRPLADPATVAQLHFNVPYLWGGNSTRGIDCSGLVQAAFLACDIPCPGDSDMQRDALGTALGDAVPLMRGDLVFWNGHVGMMVDAETLIHANAHHMACVYEPLDKAILRIAAQGDGDVLVRRRVG